MLLQMVFHARMAAERTDGTGFAIDDVADAIVGKLVRRHPHVFADVRCPVPTRSGRTGMTIKAAERKEKHGGPGSSLDGVPLGQPALSLAAQLQGRAAASGRPPSRPSPAPTTVGRQRWPGRGALRPGGARAGQPASTQNWNSRAAARRFADRVQRVGAGERAGDVD